MSQATLKELFTDKTITRSAIVEKYDAATNILTAYASVEIEDSANDIVRINGINLNRHTKDSPIKILASHQKVLADGSPPIVGKVIDIWKAEREGVPALKFTMMFADTPLALQYKQLYAKGFLDSFSIGANIISADAIVNEEGNPTGGIDYTESELYEISCVVIPANPLATVTRICKAMEELEIKATQSTNLEDKLADMLKVIKEKDDLFENRLDEIVSRLTKSIAANDAGRQQEQSQQNIETILERYMQSRNK